LLEIDIVLQMLLEFEARGRNEIAGIGPNGPEAATEARNGKVVRAAG